MRPPHFRLASLLALILCLAPLKSFASAEYVFTYLNSGFDDAIPWKINNNGQVAGQACSSTSDFCSSFLYTQNHFTTFNPPTATSSGAFGLSNNGTIVGYYTDGLSLGRGYVLRNGVYSDYQGVQGSVSLTAVTNNGYIGGLSYVPIGANVFFASGFVQAPNATTPTFVPTGLPSPLASVNAVNSSGQTVGAYSSGVRGAGPQAYLYSGGNFTLLSAPPQSAGTVVSSSAAGINDSGQIVGSFQDASGTHGFVLTNGSYSVFDAPHGGQTYLSGINDLGQIVGYDRFGNGLNVTTDSFVATLANTPSSIINGAYTFNIAVVADTTVFIDPLVASGYDYSTGAGDPNFQTVRLPIGIGNGLFDIILPNGSTFSVFGGELFDFTQHGYVDGLNEFKVRGIEVSANLDPTNPLAFVTGLTFVGGGFFTGTMTPSAISVSEPSEIALLGMGFIVALFRMGTRGRGMSARPPAKDCFRLRCHQFTG